MSTAAAAAAAASGGADKKDWKQMHQNSKLLKKKHREENFAKKAEKKRRLDAEAAAAASAAAAQSAAAPAVSTVSIAVPGSIMDNAQSAELRTYLAGQIARAACVFRVDEVIVFDDYGRDGPVDVKRRKTTTVVLPSDGQPDGNAAASTTTTTATTTNTTTTTTIHHGCLQLARILQYLECPQYLRKFFFPLHKDLQYSGLLNPLDAPHHLRQQNEFQFREGVVTSKAVRETSRSGSYVNIGLLNDCMVDKVLTPGLRVTVRLSSNEDLRSRKIKATVVSPSLPRAETGIYWGYSVRVAASLSDVFAQSPYDAGYDLTVGTSDKGTDVHALPARSRRYKHALIVFGGLQGLEAALENDDRLTVDDPALLFDDYVNIAPAQGSRTIRTEEAILIALAGLEGKLEPEQPAKVFVMHDRIPQSEDTGAKPRFEARKMKTTKTEPPVAENENNGDGVVGDVEKKNAGGGGDDLDRFD